MTSYDSFLREHRRLTRRFFLRLGAGSAAILATSPLWARDALSNPALKAAIDSIEPYFTPPGQFRDVSRGKPIPHTLLEEKRREVGLTRETWRLEVSSDSEQPSRLRKPMTIAGGTALDFAGLMKLAETKAVRFAKVMTCLNIGNPLGMGIWEGVPLREVIWKTQPVENVRRVFYYGYHNDDPQQMFRSSLPIGRVLEDVYDLPPVILCYKLNGQWLSPERGGPVRIVVPEAYGFKSIKWLSWVVLTNLAYANDTYMDGNNDVDSPLKTFAATLSVPEKISPNQSIPITGLAQVGISGLKKVQAWICREDAEPPNDPHFLTAPWADATILSSPKAWGGDLPEAKIPADTLGFDERGRPRDWPMRLTRVHWAALLPGLPAGKYTLRSRTIDDKGQAQPMPRPFQKSGNAAIERVDVLVK